MVRKFTKETINVSCGLILFVAISGCIDGREEQVFYVCDDAFNITVNFPEKSAFFESDINRTGSAEMIGPSIAMYFDKTDESSAMKIILNRKTGKATHEHGSAPFGEGSVKNDFFPV